MLRLAPDGRIYSWEEFNSHFRGYAEQYWGQAQGLDAYDETLSRQAAWPWPKTQVERDDDEEEDAEFPIQEELLPHWQRG